MVSTFHPDTPPGVHVPYSFKNTKHLCCRILILESLIYTKITIAGGRSGVNLF